MSGILVIRKGNCLEEEKETSKREDQDWVGGQIGAMYADIHMDVLQRSPLHLFANLNNKLCVHACHLYP